MRRPGPLLRDGGLDMSVVSRHATGLRLCLFDADGRETERIALDRLSASRWGGFVAGIAPGQLYGLRAEGPWAPADGHRFDGTKLLLDPYATRVDGPFLQDPRLAARGTDTSSLAPKGIVEAPPPDAAPLAPRRPGFIYEVPVRAFTRLHSDIPPADRGTVRALAHPAILDHLTRLGVDTVELMPLTLAIDERHLPPLGLANAWGYNPVGYFALDPRLAPGGIADLAAAVAALHGVGIRVLLDVVYNHTGESDDLGATLSLRGLDGALYFRHAGGVLVNDTGCGNTLALDRPEMVALVMDSLRWFATKAGIDGFRYDLGTVLGRRDTGFDPESPLLQAVAQDPTLGNLVHIAEPWDVGPGGYRLGGFPDPFGEWNDRYRDDIRRFWRGDRAMAGALATRLAGSSDIFAASGRPPSAGVNFVAAHDGMTLADCVAYAGKHNEANGEDNRDGTGDNHTWNHGTEGPIDDPAVIAARAADIRALLATLFLSRGTPMLTAGDEFGRSQRGNNNAYAQDNALTWLDWTGRDREREDFVAALAALRRAHPALHDDHWLAGADMDGHPDVVWRTEDGPMDAAAWNDPGLQFLGMDLGARGRDRILALFNAGEARSVRLPAGRWRVALATRPTTPDGDTLAMPARAVVVLGEDSAARAGVSDDAVAALAAAHGIGTEWWEISGTRHAVTPESLKAVLASLGVAAATPGDVTEGWEAVRRRASGMSGTQVAMAGPASVTLTLPERRMPARLEMDIRLEDGTTRGLSVDPITLASAGTISLDGDIFCRLILPLGELPPGRYQLSGGGHLVVAPPRCHMPAELDSASRLCGLTTHLYGVRRDGDTGLGDFETLARLGEATARLGGRLLGLNPLHHMFLQDRERASPYQPSDRRFLDPVYIDVAGAVAAFGSDGARGELASLDAELRALAGVPRVDYTRVWAAKEKVLRTLFAGFTGNAALDSFVATGSGALADHALFQAISAVNGGVDRARWPAGLAARDPAALAAFAAGHGDDIRFHLFLQWLADGQLAIAQRRTVDAGAGIGLYRDLAVGTAFDGGETWAAPETFAHGVSIGAPPDPFSASGQVWNLPPPNPLALAADGLAPWFDVLAANMRHAGALRIDHVLGFARLFFVPEGATGADGAYVRMPRDALIAATALESHRRRCLVIGEDLGTGEAGLSDALRAAGIFSTRVLWFEREGLGFCSPRSQAHGTATCLSTHDLPTFAGWRKGRDIEVDLVLGRLDAQEADRRLALRDTEKATLAEAAGVVDVEGLAGTVAVHRLLGTAGAGIVLAQVEDLVGETEPLNVPGTDREWPNWRRRLAPQVETLAGDADVQAVVAGLTAGRGG